MISHVDGRYICAKCGHTTHPGHRARMPMREMPKISRFHWLVDTSLGRRVTQRFQREAIGTHDKVEVKVGSGSIIVEQRDLDDLIEALSEMRNLASDGRAIMAIGSA